MADVDRSSSTPARRASSSRCSPSAASELDAAVARGQVEGIVHGAALRRQGRAAGDELGEKTWGEGIAARARRRARPPDRLPARAVAATAGSSPSAIASCTAASTTPAGARRRREVLAALEKLMPAGAAAPAAQPGADPDRCSSAGPSCRRSPASTPPSTAAQPPAGAGVRAADGDHRRAACAATASTACPTSTSPRCCRSSTRGPRPASTVVLHLGNGASMCAMAGGRSVASTMGFTAVDGLPMGTRCGSLDPGVMLYLMDELRMDARAIEKLIYQQSGLLGVSGISSDMRTLLASDEPRAQAARSTCSSTASAASSARSPRRSAASTRSSSPPASARTAAAIRERVCRDAAWLGVELDAGRQRSRRAAHQHAGEPRRGLGDPDQRGADDRAPHLEDRAGTAMKPLLGLARGALEQGSALERRRAARRRP